MRTVHTSESRVLETVVELARAEKLTVYDASYLGLALRVGLPLITIDRALGAAASRRGVATTLP